MAKDLAKIAIQRNYGFMKEVFEKGDDSIKMVIKSLLIELGIKEEGFEDQIFQEISKDEQSLNEADEVKNGQFASPLFRILK